ncbi:MAG: Rieske 2Fe-2S domain-containing protein [Myxococcales bacterium]|nr:Rieske 2Fe-2S domain-containing protein [Myxococcales bacterium]MCB9714198.1 Rieske 2Fe-2S domain-containing protein [Myxococcales bacterium]
MVSTKRYMRPPPQYVHSWFAPLRSSDVVPGKITNFTFMGHELIAFRDEGGQVVVLDAQCPHFGAHRGVGGRVVDGCVRCPFHGLHFDRTGECVKGDFVDPSRRLGHIKTVPWTAREAAASIFIWHGVDRQRPDQPLPFAEPGFFDGWSPPVTNAGRPLRPTNVFFPTENIIDIQHFYAVHFWELHEIIKEPGEDEDGNFSAVMRMTWKAGAQSPYAVVRRLGNAYQSQFHFDIRILGPGMALSISTLTPEQGGLQLMNIILITPVSPTDCHIRVVTSVKRTVDKPLNRLARRVLGAGLEELLSRVFLAIATKDFDGDEMIWTHRRFLANPKPLADDGPLIPYRQWCERFWPPDYLPDPPDADAEPEPARPKPALVENA